MKNLLLCRNKWVSEQNTVHVYYIRLIARASQNLRSNYYLFIIKLIYGPVIPPVSCHYK